MDGSIQFGLLEMLLIRERNRMLCNIVLLWFWVSVALNFNCLGAREEGLILLGNDEDSDGLGWKRLEEAGRVAESLEMNWPSIFWGYDMLLSGFFDQSSVRFSDKMAIWLERLLLL